MTNQATTNPLLLPIRPSAEMKSFLTGQGFTEITSTLWEMPTDKNGQPTENGVIQKQEVERFYNGKI